VGKVTGKLPTGLQFNGKSYLIDKRCDGVRIKRHLGNVSYEDAIRLYSEAIADVKRGSFVRPSASSLTVNDVLTHYYNSHLVNIKSGANAKYHIPAISRHIGNKAVLSLHRSDVEQYKVARMREGKVSKSKEFKSLSQRTLQAELQHLSMAINRAVDDEMIPRNPIIRFCKVSLPRQRKIVLDHGQEFGPEWICLYKHLPEKWRLFFLICYETGMRPSEVANFHTSWVTFVTQDAMMITIPPDMEKTSFSDRRIPVSQLLAKRLRRVIGVKGKLFKSHSYFKAFSNAIKESGLRDEITAYALRRTRATIWDALDPAATRVALGHSPLDPHEESYVEITNERLFRLVNVNLKNKLSLLKFG